MTKLFALVTEAQRNDIKRSVKLPQLFPVIEEEKHGPLVDVGAGNGHRGSSKSVSTTDSYWWLAKEKCQVLTLEQVTAMLTSPPMVVEPSKLVAPKKSVKKAVKVDENGKPKLSPQCKEILALLEAKGSITSLEAGGVLRARALPRRIADLKEAGFKISRVLSNDTTGQRYARYYLKQAA
jgi:hypothetical protein